MKLLWVSHFYPYPPAGGALQRSYHLLRQAADRHDVCLVALYKDRNRPAADEVAADYAAPREFCENVTLLPIPSEHRPGGRIWVLLSGLWSSRPYDDRWLATPALEKHLAEVMREAAPDLVHLDSIGLARYGSSLGTTPTVMNHHNIESHMMARRAERTEGFLRQRYMAAEAEKLARWEREWSGQYEQNLVVSSLDGERLEEIAPDASWTVVPNGVDTDFFQPGTDVNSDAREGMLFVGRLSWYPNRDAVEWLMNDIWPVLTARQNDLSLTLVGSSPPEHLAEDGEPENVCATGFVPDVRPYFDRASVYICPIRTGGGTRLKILDAMAMGIPLVATGMSVEGLTLTEGVHFLRAETPEEFADAVDALECDGDLRRKLATEARKEAVERFSWSYIGDRLEEAYQSSID